MKKLLILFLYGFFSLNFSNVVNAAEYLGDLTENRVKFETKNFNKWHNVIDDIKDFKGLKWYQSSKFEYIADKNDYWKTPFEFVKDGGGDCEDFAIYYISVLKKYTDFKDLAIGVYYDNSLKSYHAVALEKKKDKYYVYDVNRIKPFVLTKNFPRFLTIYKVDGVYF